MAFYILAFGLLIFLSYFFSSLYEKTKVPDVLLLMIIGIIVGPVLQIIYPDFFGKFGSVLTTIALIVILFEGGTTINLKTLSESIGPTMIVTLSTFVVTLIIAALFSVVVLRLEVLPSLMLGTIIGGTSSAVVVPMVKGLNMKEPAGTVLILESAITDVLCIVLTGAFLDIYLKGGGADGQIAVSIFLSLFVAVIMGLIGGLGWLFIITRVDRFRRSMFSTVAAVFIGYGVAEQLGYSGAITALSFGFTLTNFKSFRFDRLPVLKEVAFAVINEPEKNFYKEIVFILKTFFFVFLGLSIRFDSVWSFLAALVLVLVIYAARLLLCRVVVSRKTPQKEVSFMSIMVPKGLAAAVLAGIPLQMEVTGGDVIQNVVYEVVLISIVMTAVLVPLIDKTKIRLHYQRFFSTFAPDDDPAKTNGQPENKASAGVQERTYENRENITRTDSDQQN